jgi:hypothetical protein
MAEPAWDAGEAIEGESLISAEDRQSIPPNDQTPPLLLLRTTEFALSLCPSVCADSSTAIARPICSVRRGIAGDGAGDGQTPSIPPSIHSAAAATLSADAFVFLLCVVLAVVRSTGGDVE